MSKSTIGNRLKARIDMCLQWTNGHRVIHKSDLDVLLTKQRTELFEFLNGLPRYINDDLSGDKNMAQWEMKDFIIEELKKQFGYEKE